MHNQPHTSTPSEGRQGLEPHEDIVDLEDIARGLPVPKPGRGFRIRIDRELYVITDGTPTGAELLALAGTDPSASCLFQQLRGGAQEPVAATDSVDLLGRGVERFVTRPAVKLCIEGTDFPWCRETITTEEIAKLGGWDPAQGVIEVDENQSERTLAPGEVVHIRPGTEFGKRHCWKRG